MMKCSEQGDLDQGSYARPGLRLDIIDRRSAPLDPAIVARESSSLDRSKSSREEIQIYPGPSYWLGPRRTS